MNRVRFQRSAVREPFASVHGEKVPGPERAVSVAGVGTVFYDPEDSQDLAEQFERAAQAVRKADETAEAV